MKKKQIQPTAEHQEQPEEATPATTPAEQDQKDERSERTRRKKPVAVPSLQQDSDLGYEGVEDLESESQKQNDDKETESIKRNIVSYFQRLVALMQNVPEGVAAATLNLEEPRQVVYVIATFMQMELELRQKLLELDSVRAKLENLSSYLTHELEIFELGKKIQTSAQEEMGKVQREYLLREQLKPNQREFGEEREAQAN